MPITQIWRMGMTTWGGGEQGEKQGGKGNREKKWENRGGGEGKQGENGKKWEKLEKKGWENRGEKTGVKKKSLREKKGRKRGEKRETNEKKAEYSRKFHYDIIYFRLNSDDVTRPARYDSHDPYPTSESYRAGQLLQKLISFFFWDEKGNFRSFSGVFPLSTFLFA